MRRLAALISTMLPAVAAMTAATSEPTDSALMHRAHMAMYHGLDMDTYSQDELAAQIYQDLASRGNARAKAMLALCHYNGQGVIRSTDTARRLATEAFGQGDAFGKYLLLRLEYDNKEYVDDRGTFDDLLRLLDGCAEAGVPEAAALKGDLYRQLSLSRCHWSEASQEHDAVDRALEAYAQAYRDGNPLAALKYMTLRWQSDNSQSMRDNVREMAQAYYDNPDPAFSDKGQAALNMFFCTYGDERRSWLDKAVELGNPEAMYWKAYMILDTDTVLDEDIDTALRLLAQAAASGDDLSCRRLAELYENGTYVETDPQMALNLLEHSDSKHLAWKDIVRLREKMRGIPDHNVTHPLPRIFELWNRLAQTDCFTTDTGDVSSRYGKSSIEAAIAQMCQGLYNQDLLQNSKKYKGSISRIDKLKDDAPMLYANANMLVGMAYLMSLLSETRRQYLQEAAENEQFGLQDPTSFTYDDFEPDFDFDVIKLNNRINQYLANAIDMYGDGLGLLDTESVEGCFRASDNIEALAESFALFYMTALCSLSPYKYQDFVDDRFISEYNVSETALQAIATTRNFLIDLINNTVVPASSSLADMLGLAIFMRLNTNTVATEIAGSFSIEPLLEFFNTEVEGLKQMAYAGSIYYDMSPRLAADIYDATLHTKNYFMDYTDAMQREEPTGAGLWRKVRRQLGPKDAAVEFIMQRDLVSDNVTYYGLVLRKGDEYPHMARLLSGERLKALMADKRAFNSDETYKAVWGPLAPWLEGCDHIYFAADGDLHTFPIENLPVDGERYIDQVYTLTRLPSTLHIERHKKREPWQLDQAQALLVGGVDYGTTVSRRRDNFGYLEGSLREVQDIDSLLSAAGCQARVFDGSDATEGELRKALHRDRYQLLHFATHGYKWSPVYTQHLYRRLLDEEALAGADYRLLSAGLVCSGANDFFNGTSRCTLQDDGLFSAADLSSCKLGDTRLVVLSACKSGLGEFTGGSLYGLYFALKLAGADAVLMNLWNVDDTASTLLMHYFYDALASGADIPAALATAKARLRDYTPDSDASANGGYVAHPYADPYFWAGFILAE